MIAFNFSAHHGLVGRRVFVSILFMRARVYFEAKGLVKTKMLRQIYALNLEKR
jgi:hypothetical protein